MSIKVWSYLKEFESEKEAILKAVTTVFESGTLILGQQVSDFEESFSAYCECKFGIGVNSATDALFLSLKALNIGEGDEVITVSNTAVPTVSAIVASGASPVFVDIDESTYLMNITLLEKLVTPKTRCILPVHLFGQCVDMDEVNRIAKKHNLFVLEDCSQSHGALYKNKKCGSLSDLAVFSFYPTKILGAYGDGGMVVTSNEKLHKKLKRLRFYGMEKQYYALEQGYNSRLDEVQAAILNFKLNHLDAYIQRRREIAQLYSENLNLDGLTLPKTALNNQHAYYLYVVRHSKRDEILAYLKKHDIFVNISYPWPIHEMQAYNYLNYKNGDLPQTELMAKEIFSLPMYPSLTNEEVLHVCEKLNAFE